MNSLAVPLTMDLSELERFTMASSRPGRAIILQTLQRIKDQGNQTNAQWEQWGDGILWENWSKSFDVSNHRVFMVERSMRSPACFP